MFAAGFCSNGAQKQAIIANKRKVEQQPRIMDARRRKAASSSEVCDECDLTDDRGARSLTACASVPVANASRTCFPTGQEPPVEVLHAADAARRIGSRCGRTPPSRREARPREQNRASRSSYAVFLGPYISIDSTSHSNQKVCTHRRSRLPVVNLRNVLLSVSVSVGEPLDNCMQARKRARSALEGRLAPPQLVFIR